MTTIRASSTRALVAVAMLVAGLLCAAAIAAGSHDPTSHTSSIGPGPTTLSGVAPRS